MIIKKKLNYSVLLALAAFLLCLPMILFDNLPVRDVAARYVPMAEAFARGDWQNSFHARIPPLFTIVSGIFVRLFYMSGTAACELSSALFFALTIFILMALIRQIFNQKYAVWTAGMFICCSRLLRIAGMGLRDSAKCFFIVLAAYGLIYFFRKYDWKGAIYCSLGCVGLALIRGDSLLFALLFLVALFVIELYKQKGFPYKSCCTIIIFLSLISPWLCYEYKHTGWPVTELRHAILLNKIFKDENSVVAIATVINQQNKNINAVQKTKKESFIKNLIKGLCPQYLLFIIPVLFYRIHKKILSSEEIILLLITLIHITGMIGQIAIADKRLFIYKRYLIVATPLTFGWAAIGLRWLFDELRKFFKLKYRWIAKGILIAWIAFFIFNAWSRVRKSRINPFFYRIVKQHTGVNLER